MGHSPIESSHRKAFAIIQLDFVLRPARDSSDSLGSYFLCDCDCDCDRAAVDRNVGVQWGPDPSLLSKPKAKSRQKAD